MTDRTQPDSASTTGSTHIIRYALELGLLWIDGDGRDKVREALDALDTIEAQLEAIGAGGVSGPLVGRATDMSKEREALDAYLKDCDAHDIVPDVGGAWHAAFQAGRASLSANAGGPTQGAFQRALSIRTAQGWTLRGDKVPVLYTDEINGEQVCRDDVWLCTTAAFAAPPTAQAEGWTKATEQLPPCRDEQLYIGVNSVGYAGVFNAVASIAGNVHCMYETAEGSTDVMSDLAIWKPFNPPTSAEGVEHG